jgi:hypothetical protein
MAHFPSSPSPRPVERPDISPTREQSHPTQRATRTLTAQPKPSPRIVPRIQLSPRVDAVRVEVVTTVATTTPHIASPAPRPEKTPRARAEKGDRSPEKKSRKHTRHKTHDLALPSAPTLKAHRSRHSAGDKEGREVKPELKDESPRLKPQAPMMATQPAGHSPRTPKGLGQSASAKTSPRFVVSRSPQSSPKTPRLMIGKKQPPSSPISQSQTDLLGDRPVQPGQSTPVKPPSVQQRRAFFERLAQSANQPPPVRNATVPLTRSATAQSRSGKLSRVTESTGLPEIGSTKPHS